MVDTTEVDHSSDNRVGGSHAWSCFRFLELLSNLSHRGWRLNFLELNVLIDREKVDRRHRDALSYSRKISVVVCLALFLDVVIENVNVVGGIFNIDVFASYVSRPLVE